MRCSTGSPARRASSCASRSRARSSLRLPPGVTGALGRVIIAVHDAVADGSWQRLKACRARDCEWAFIDTAKNQSRAWCSMRSCGNREKARAYRRRHAQCAVVGAERGGEPEFHEGWGERRASYLLKRATSAPCETLHLSRNGH